MRVVAGLDRLDHSDAPVFVVVGVFDGLHLGHAYLLRHLVAEARARSARPVVITFDHHPDEILVGNAPPLLCDPEERLERLAAAGVDTTVVVHFDQRLRETRFDAFVALIAARAPLVGFLMTPDAAFGYQRAGTPAALAELGRRQGFEVVVVPPFLIDGRQVSSSEVRAAIARGDLASAARLLGRDHCVVGEVRDATSEDRSAGAHPADVGAGADPVGVGADAAIVRFSLPVALPPDGRYRVRVSPRVDAPLRDGQVVPREVELDASGRPSIAWIGAGHVRIAGPRASGWFRIAFGADDRRAVGGEESPDSM